MFAQSPMNNQFSTSSSYDHRTCGNFNVWIANCTNCHHLIKKNQNKLFLLSTYLLFVNMGSFHGISFDGSAMHSVFFFHLLLRKTFESIIYTD